MVAPSSAATRVILARAHRKLGQAVFFRQFTQFAEIRARRFGVFRERRHGRQTADVRVEIEQLRDAFGRDSGLRFLAREIDLDQRRDLQTLGGRGGVERVDELADAVHELGLAALEVADEVPAERVAVGGVLRLEVLRAVLADDLDPRLGQRGHVLHRHVLGGCDDRHVRADFLAYPRQARGDLFSGQRQGRPVSRAAGPCAAPRRRDPSGSACRDRRARPRSRPHRARPAPRQSRGRACLR